MKKTINDHPYAVTTVIFLVIFLVGMVYFQWDREELVFLLLLYLVAAIGIRLDDVVQRLDAIEITFEKVQETEETRHREMVKLAAAINRIHGIIEADSSSLHPGKQPVDGSSREPGYNRR